MVTASFFTQAKKTKNKNTLVYKTIVTLFSNVDENNEIKRFVYILFNGEP